MRLSGTGWGVIGFCCFQGGVMTLFVIDRQVKADMLIRDMSMHSSYLMAVVPVLVGSVVAADTQPSDSEINASLIRQKAEAGDMVSQRRMGILYLAGSGGLEKSREEGIKWLRKAVLQGDVTAQGMLGMCLVFNEHSWGVSMENGNVQFGIRLHLDLQTNKRNLIETNADRAEYREGMDLLKPIVQQDESALVFFVCGLLFDRDDAVREQGWSIVHELQNDPSEDERMMAVLISGLVGIASQYPDARNRGIELLTEGLSKMHDREKIEPIFMSVMALYGGDVQTLRSLLEKMAAEGNTDAEVLLAMSYADEDDGKELEWYESAARKGNLKAMVCLAYGYFHGTFVPKDEAKSFRWMTLAAEGGNAQGMSGLAECYREGFGVERDDKKAMFWEMKAQAAMKQEKDSD